MSKKSGQMSMAMHAAIGIPIAILMAIGLIAYNPEFGFAAKVNPFKAMPKRDQKAPLKSKVKQVEPINSPVVTQLPLGSTILGNFDQDLIKFNVKPLHPGVLGLRQVVFSYSKSQGVTLSNFRLRSGATDLPLGGYSVTAAATAADLESGFIASTSVGGLVVLSLSNDEPMIGSGNTYTLHATAGGVTAGKTVTLSFYNSPQGSMGNGYLTHSMVPPFAYSPYIYHLDTTSPPEGINFTADLPGAFIWSDHSAAATNGMIGISGGSADWFNSHQPVGSQTLAL